MAKRKKKSGFKSMRFTGTRTPDGHYGFSSTPQYNRRDNLVGRRDGTVDQRGFDNAFLRKK